jgi:hypothetical protein
MAEDVPPGDSLSAGERARLHVLAALLESADGLGAVRLAASELTRLAEQGEDGATLPPPPTFDLHVHFATEEELRPDAEPDPDLEAELQAIRARLGPELVDGVNEIEPVILRRVAEDPEWAVEFAVRPLVALRSLDPPVEPRLLEALERAGGGPEEAFVGFDGQIRVVEAGRASRDAIEAEGSP